jgi:hypothetical protein
VKYHRRRAANNDYAHMRKRAAHSLLSLRKISENGQKSTQSKKEMKQVKAFVHLEKCFILLRSRALGQKEKGWSAVKSGIYCAINSTWPRCEINYRYENAASSVVTKGEGGEREIGMEKRQKWVSQVKV